MWLPVSSGETVIDTKVSPWLWSPEFYMRIKEAEDEEEEMTQMRKADLPRSPDKVCGPGDIRSPYSHSPQCPKCCIQGCKQTDAPKPELILNILYHTSCAGWSCEVCTAYSASFKLNLKEVCFSSFVCNKKLIQLWMSEQNPAIFLSVVIGMDFED